MKKIFFSFIVVTGTLFGLISCDNTTIDPVASVVTDIEFVSPEQGTQLTLSANFVSETAMLVKWNSANFGYSAAVGYTLQIVKASEDFSNPQLVILGNFNESAVVTHEFSITHKKLNAILLAAGGTIENPQSYKMRIVGAPNTQVATSANALMSYSQEVTFSSNVYDIYDEILKIYLPGNFGAASTYADWSINTSGTSNSPMIYSPLNDGKYSGFVWMNVNAPAFKFANPDTANLNIKGLGATPGELIDTADILAINNIVVPYVPTSLTTSGPGAYYVTADWVNNTYTIAKRKIAIIGPAASGWTTPIYMDFDTNPASPYYRMYTKTLNLAANYMYIRLKDDNTVKFGALGSTGTLLVGVQNKVKLGGGFFQVPAAGNYTVVLDTKNSANYNLRIIQN